MHLFILLFTPLMTKAAFCGTICSTSPEEQDLAKGLPSPWQAKSPVYTPLPSVLPTFRFVGSNRVAGVVDPQGDLRFLAKRAMGDQDKVSRARGSRCRGTCKRGRGGVVALKVVEGRVAGKGGFRGVSGMGRRMTKREARWRGMAKKAPESVLERPRWVLI